MTYPADKQSQEVVDAVREMLGFEPLYAKGEPPTDLERFGARAFVGVLPAMAAPKKHREGVIARPYMMGRPQTIRRGVL